MRYGVSFYINNLDFTLTKDVDCNCATLQIKQDGKSSLETYITSTEISNLSKMLEEASAKLEEIVNSHTGNIDKLEN